MKNTNWTFRLCGLLYLLLASALHTHAQNGIINKAFFSTENVEQFNHVIELADGGYLTIGSQGLIDPVSQLNSSQQVYVVRYDKDLKEVWTRILGDAGNDFINGALVLPDGNYMLAGQYALQPDGNPEGWLVKLSATDGAIMWTKTFGGSGLDMFNSIFLQPNGDLVMSGFTNSVDGVNAGRAGSDEDLWLLRVDQQGNIVRRQWIGGSGDDGRYQAMQRTSKGFCLRVYSTSTDGYFSGAPDNTSSWLVEVDENFNVLRKKLVFAGIDFYYFFTGLVVDKNDGVYIGDHNIIYFDSNWDEVWSRKPLANNGKEPWLMKLSLHPDGGILAYGNNQIIGEQFAVRDSAFNQNGYLERIASSGETKWVRYFGGRFSDGVNTAILNSKKNYVVGGFAMDKSCDNARPGPQGRWPDGSLFEWKEPNVIKGKVFIDVNDNLKYDPGIDGDIPYEAWGNYSIQVTITKGSLNWNCGNLRDFFYAALDSGTYEFKVTRLFANDDANFGNLSLGPEWNQFNMPKRISFSGQGQTDSIFIALSRSPFSDVTVAVEQRSSGAIGTKANYSLIWQITGGKTFDSARISMSIPTGSTFSSASSQPIKLTADSAVWMVKGGTAPLMDSLRFVLQLPKAPSAKVGDTVKLPVVIKPYGIIEEETNNSYLLEHLLIPQSGAITSLVVRIQPGILPIPSGEATYKIYYTYTGELDSILADLSYWQENRFMDLISASPGLFRKSGDSVIWNGTTLINGKTDSAFLRFRVLSLPDVAYGASIYSHARLFPLLAQGAQSVVSEDVLTQQILLSVDTVNPNLVTDEQGIEWIGNIETPDTWAYQSVAYIDSLPGKDLIIAALGLAKTPLNGGLLLHKSDANGMIKWRKLYRDLTGTVRGLKTLPDGRFGVLLNNTRVTSGVVVEQWGTVILFDSSGQKIWQREIARDSIPGTVKTWVDLLDLDFLPGGSMLVSGSLRYGTVTDSTYSKGVVAVLPLNGSAPAYRIFAKERIHFAFGKITVGEHGEVFTTATIDARQTALAPGVNAIPNSIAQLDLLGNKVIWERKSDRTLSSSGYADILAWNGRLFAIGCAIDAPVSYGFADVCAYDGSSPGFKEFKMATPGYLFAITPEQTGFAILGAVYSEFGFSSVPAIIRLDESFEISSFKVLKPKRTSSPGIQTFKSIVSLENNALVIAGSGRALAVNNLPVGFDESRYHIVKLNTSDVLNGFVYFDANNNGIYDAGEKPVDNVSVVARNSDYDEPDLQTTPIDGRFSFNFSPGQRVLKVKSLNGSTLAKPDSAFVFMYGGMQKDSVTFRMIPLKDSSDLQVQLLPLNTARPGFEAEYRLLYRNSGPIQAANVVLTIGKDSRQQFVTANPAPSFNNGDSLRWNLGSMTGFSEGVISITMRNSPPPTLNNKDSLLILARIEPRTRDALPENNVTALFQPVKGSFDPNDKTEINNGTITPQQVANREALVYMIRFQNTGNDTAFRVYVMDTLDSKLDISSIEILSFSHPVRWSVTGKGVIKWEFNNIVLPDSISNEKASHGYVSFRIKPVSSIRLGEVIRNNASIYFDFNLPVLTNTVITTVANRLVTPVTSVRNPALSVNAFPNPLGESLTVELKGPVRGSLVIRIIDINGRIMIVKPFGKLFTQDWRSTINVSSLTSGIYTVLVQIDNDIVPFKILKL